VVWYGMIWYGGSKVFVCGVSVVCVCAVCVCGAWCLQALSWRGLGMRRGRVKWGGVGWGDKVSRHGDVLGCMIWGWPFLHSVSTFIAFIDISCMYWDPEGRVSGDIE
jgi:hypothetical protein